MILGSGISAYSPIHYGDPPRHDCPGAGNVMNSTPLVVQQFWSKPSGDWERIKDYEWTIGD